jgi:hypothetical protein
VAFDDGRSGSRQAPPASIEVVLHPANPEGRAVDKWELPAQVVAYTSSSVARR